MDVAKHWKTAIPALSATLTLLYALAILALVPTASAHQDQVCHNLAE